MLPPGHLAVSYILVKSAELAGFNVSFPETLVILAGSIILDFDIVFASFLKKSHHDLATHTPLGVFGIWLSFVLPFGSYFSTAAKVLILLCLLLHLVLDETGFWLCRLRLQEISEEPQINWLYPLTKFPDGKTVYENHPFDFSWLDDYIRKAKANVFLEIVLSLIALLVFWLT
ncbi:MAG: hypothetical protein Q8N16_01225 [bacterium]|nr:hypothetical protein [bacterium]